jgi:hypothetical protein
MQPAAARRSLARALLLSCALASGLSGCRRKAPGPDECVAFAFASYGIPTKGARLTPGLRDKVDELTRECLLTPFDRELLECTFAGGAPRACMRAFSLRHDGLVPSHRRR